MKTIFHTLATAGSCLATLLYPHSDCHADQTSSGSQIVAMQLADLPLEDLMRIQIYSVAKQPEPVMESAAAIHVITKEDIRRSGVTSIPDALRLAPGVHVARIDANKWSVSVRGFADRYANKLLVLLDGRTLYSPTFSGVWWNIQDIMIEDIDRIEVIRGPGATLWGANAMNGVINIITRSARDTDGGLAVAGGGTFEKGFGALRYGMNVSEDLAIRGYGRFFSRDRQETAKGYDQEGSWDNWSGGFRSDWTPNQYDNITLQGDRYDSRAGAAYFSGGNILIRWNRQIAASTSSMVQAYYNYSEQHAVNSPDQKFREKRSTCDLETQINFRPLAGHDASIGAAYRYSGDTTAWNSNTSFIPADSDDHMVSMFLRDNITVFPEKVFLTLGVRLEHNDYTGIQYQPTGRLLWTPSSQHSFWAAISRAVRTPSRANDGISATVGSFPPGGLFPGSPTAYVNLSGNNRLKSELLIAYELGYRSRLSKNIWLDMALFYHDYDRLIGISAHPPYLAGTSMVIPYVGDNNVHAETWGTELSAFWQPLEILDLQASYSLLEMKTRGDEPNEFRGKLSQIGTYPEQQFSIRSGISMPKRIRLDLWLRYVDRLERDRVTDYAELDARVSWNPFKTLEIAITGQNLLKSRHYEFSDDFFGAPATMTERSMYGKITWKF